MSDKNKLLFVGIGITVVAVATAVIFYSLGRKSPVAPSGTPIERPSVLVDESVYEFKGAVTFKSVEGTDITISSADGAHSFSISSAIITDMGGSPVKGEDIMIGMEIEATVQKNSASAIQILSVPLIAVTSPPLDAPLNLSFDIIGKTPRDEGDICLNFSNRRTGTVYEDGLSALIQKNGNFSIPVDLSSALDAMAGDTLDARLSICGEDEETLVSWKYYSGYVSKIKVYFLKNSCSNFYYVERVIPASYPAMRTSIEEILKGPSDKEKENGLFSVANPKETINDINVQSDAVYINFNSTILNVSRCSVSALKTQIDKTLEGLSSGQKYVITVNGDKDNPLN
jgi:hypothetical protein